MTTHSHDRPLLGYFALFGSLATLVCCALPSLLVLLGLGTAVASVLSAAPWLVWLSRSKEWMFPAVGLLIAANFGYVYRISPRLRGRTGACAAEDAEACERAARLTRALLWTSAAIYPVAFFVAFVLGPLLAWLYA